MTPYNEFGPVNRNVLAIRKIVSGGCQVLGVIGCGNLLRRRMARVSKINNAE